MDIWYNNKAKISVILATLFYWDAVFLYGLFVMSSSVLRRGIIQRKSKIFNKLEQTSWHLGVFIRQQMQTGSRKEREREKERNAQRLASKMNPGML